MVLRATANFGPCELWLVAPERPSLLVHPEFEQMAHGVEDMRARCVVVGTLREALADCTSSVAFTARVRGHRVRRDWRDARDEVARKAADPGERVALVFGNEITGLESEHTDLCQELVHVRTSKEHTSLNLALCVGIALADIFTEPGYKKPEPGGSMLDGEGREFLKAKLKRVLGEVALTPPARRDIEASIERVFSRATLENRDARAWHLILRALGGDETPADFGCDPTPARSARRSQALERARNRGEEPDAN
jgi:tRNA C32,U32 (ribose-2'-O)-methylase TrmJ